MSAPSERQKVLAQVLAMAARISDARGSIANALATERDAAIEECAALVERPRCRGWSPKESAWQIRQQLKSNKLAAGRASEQPSGGFESHTAEAGASMSVEPAASIEEELEECPTCAVQGSPLAPRLARLKAKLVAAEAVMGEARRALKIAEACRCSYGPCGCGERVANGTELEEALAAYDAAGGGG